MSAEIIGAIAAAAALVITALAAGVAKVVHEIRDSREGSRERHALTRERLDVIEGAAVGAQVEAGTANARIADLERQLAEARSKRGDEGN